MPINYKINTLPTPAQICALYNDAGLKRPINDMERIRKIYSNSNLVITAWDDTLLIGVARSITDFAWSCYLADLAIREQYQKLGIGKKLIELTKEEIGEQTMLLLLSVPDAMEYYPKMGFVKQESSFIMNRVK